MNPYIRTLIEGISRRPVLIRHSFLTEGVTVNVAAKEVTSWGNFAADLKALATVDVTEQMDMQQLRRDELCRAYGFNGSDVTKPFAFSQGNAIIPIHGTLMNRLPYSFGFATGYNFITSQVNAAMADPDVTQIVYDINSNGGMVSGCPECSDVIWQASAANGGKPSIGVIDSNCYSAAYYLASGMDHLALTPSGGAGSIGVLQMHMDISKALDEFGVKVTFIKAGDHKVDGNMFEPLSEEVTADLQAQIDKIYTGFVSDVSAHRPGLTEKAVRDTQARCYQADEALSLGLVDSVQSPSSALQSLVNTTGDDDTMATATETKTVLTQADVDTAAAAARTAERARMSGIMGHAEAKDRQTLASHLANNTEMSVEAAAAVLAVAAKETAVVAPVQGEADGKTNFEKAMENGSHPNVGGGGSSNDGKGMTRAQQILAAQSKATGRPQEAAK